MQTIIIKLSTSPLSSPSSPGLFGASYTEKLKSQLFLAHHKVYGASAKGRRHRTTQMVLRALTGESHHIAVARQATVGDLQEVVCLLFEKPFPGTKVKFIANQVVFDEFADLPFQNVKRYQEVRVIFNGKVNVTIRGLNGETCEIAVDPDTSLRDMQLLLCRLFHQRHPAMKATLIVGNNVYDEFIEIPFKNLTGSVDANVVFAKTDDPYFYDLRERRRQPARGSSPPALRLA